MGLQVTTMKGQKGRERGAGLFAGILYTVHDDDNGNILVINNQASPFAYTLKSKLQDLSVELWTNFAGGA